MDIGVVTVRDRDYHPNRRLLEAAAQKGCSLALVNPYRLGPCVRQGRLCLQGMQGRDVPRVILPRQGAQVGESSLCVLGQLAAMGVPMVNGTAAIRVARDKFATLRVLAAAGIAVPDSVFVNSGTVFYAAVESLGGFPVVLKKPSGRQGSDVFLLKDAQDAEPALSRHLDPARGLLLQRFIAPQGRRDLRVLVMDGRVVAAMELLPGPGDFRSNYHITERSRAVQLPPDLAKIAEKSARAVGLDIAGVDVIVDAAGEARVIEVNYSPGFRGLEAATGMDIAGRIVSFALGFIRPGAFGCGR